MTKHTQTATISARYAGTCAKTGKDYPAGTQITKLPNGKWAIADGASVAGNYSRPKPEGRRCAECGRPGATVEDMEDGLIKHYGCCDMPPARY